MGTARHGAIGVLSLLLLAGSVHAQPRRIAVIAHRGEHRHHPENTIPAFEEAIREGRTSSR